jgi:glutathione synthase/RimK-type ligase-like ATP-grasp enzyme
MKSVIGIYSRPTDDHLERVIIECQRHKLSWVCFDTQDFPQALQISAVFGTNTRGWQGDFLLKNSCYLLENMQSIWYRRPTKSFHFPEGLSEEGYEYAQAEAQRGFEGLLHALPVRWVSHPDAIRAAEWKPQQLAHAQQVGLCVPKTLITNDPQIVFSFLDECRGEMVYKPFNQGVPRPKVGQPWRGSIYTTKLTRTDIEQHAPNIALTAHLFQEYIPKAFELRINIIGTRVFAAEIHSQHSERARIDFRMGYSDLFYRVHQLPHQIEQACLSLVQYFHLQFSAIDMLVTPENKYVFLELNACGQWGWIETHTGLPLTEALVDLLSMA